MARRKSKRTSRSRKRHPLLAQLKFLLLGILAFYASIALSLFAFRFVAPPFTAMQVQRRIESWLEGDREYQKRYQPVSPDRISSHVAHAIIASEDGRFYEHHGVDWEAINAAIEDNAKRKRPRGGSTITQQLVKNLFLTSHSTVWRKAIEIPAAYLADLILPKDRILYLYMTVIEWGTGVYGIEAAGQYHYGVSASQLDRSRASRLAACIPAPRSRRPQQMHRLSASIRRRMAQHGW